MAPLGRGWAQCAALRFLLSQASNHPSDETGSWDLAAQIATGSRESGGDRSIASKRMFRRKMAEWVRVFHATPTGWRVRGRASSQGFTLGYFRTLPTGEMEIRAEAKCLDAERPPMRAAFVVDQVDAACVLSDLAPKARLAGRSVPGDQVGFGLAVAVDGAGCVVARRADGV